MWLSTVSQTFRTFGGKSYFCRTRHQSLKAGYLQIIFLKNNTCKENLWCRMQSVLLITRRLFNSSAFSSVYTLLRINTATLLIKKQNKKVAAQEKCQNSLYRKQKGRIGLITNGIWGNSIFNFSKCQSHFSHFITLQI